MIDERERQIMIAYALRTELDELMALIDEYELVDKDVERIYKVLARMTLYIEMMEQK